MWEPVSGPVLLATCRVRVWFHPQPLTAWTSILCKEQLTPSPLQHLQGSPPHHLLSPPWFPKDPLQPKMSFFFIYLEREPVGERLREGGTEDLHRVRVDSTEPGVGLEPTNLQIMT